QRPESDRRLPGRRARMNFFIEVVAGGLLAGVMYALVALGFVIIYKASGVFNFAQGSLVFFAALTFVSLLEHLARAGRDARRHGGGRDADRTHRAAAARQPAADHAADGDDRAHVRA